MAYRELFVVEVKEILRLWARGHGYRTVEQRTSVNRKTVRRYVEAAIAFGLCREAEGRAVDDDLVAEVVSVVRPGGPRDAGAMRSHCRAHRKLVEGWLEDGCKGPKVVKLLARHTGVVVPLRTLQRFVLEELDGNRRGDTVRIADGEPGQILEVDFMELGVFEARGTGQRRKMHALLCTSNYSRHQFVWPCLSQTQDDVIAGLEAAWRFFGGVFAVVVSDNLSAVVDVAHPTHPKLNASFVEYTQARGFEVDAARSRKPKDKARVERQVQFVRNDYFAGERFGDVEEARFEAVRWCREDAGLRIHGRTRQRPLEVFNRDELPLLGEAPTAPYDEPRWLTLQVGRDHAVVVNYALYSVPFHVAEGELRVRLDRASVKLYRGAQLIKIHPRQPAGGAHIDPADLPPGKAELATRDGTSLQRIAAGYGPTVGLYAERLLDSPLPWTRMRFVYRLLGLARRYGGALVDEACAQALALDVVDVMRIDRMLERGLVARNLVELPPPSTPKTSNLVPLRFARKSSEWQTSTPEQGDPDALA